jgi:predicted outer membrane repeat protein
LFRFVRVIVYVLVVLALVSGPSNLNVKAQGSQPATAGIAAPAGGVVGDGTPGSCTEAALSAALAGGGTVTFDCGGPKTILVLSEKNITQATTVDGGGIITLTGGLTTRLFRVDAAGSLVMKNITLDSAYNFNTSGGAIWSAGPLTLTNVTIQNSQTGNQFCGGALLVAGDTVITNSTFNKNTASLGGGAICVRSQPGTHVQIIASTFTGNQAVDATLGYGGGLYVEYGTAFVRDSVFLSNSAHLGGAVYAAPNVATISLEGSASSSPYASKMQLNANTASEDGGAIYNKGGAISIDNTVITVNRTPTQTLLAGYGGGIYSEGVLTLTNSIVGENEGRYGGGVFVGNSPTGARAMIDNTIFLNNISGNLGGGLYTNILTTTVTLNNSVFNGNTARAGGGLARSNADLHVFNSSFTFNTATLGGGLLLSAVPQPTSGPYVRVQSVTVSGNTASSNQGGGVYNEGLVELYSTTIVSNTNGVFSRGGGNTRFRDSVLRNPGSLNCDGDGTAQISDDSHNFSADNSCVLPNSSVGAGLDPMLSPLTSDIFGPTYYHMPRAGSPLINAATNCPELDQRGAWRPNACDIGAVEFGGLFQVSFLPFLMR